MKFWKTVGSFVLVLLLICSVALTLFGGLYRFVLCNPSFLKTFLPTKSFCDDLREQVGEDLDHVAILYGLEEGSLDALITDEELRSFLCVMVDAFYAANSAESVALPAYPAEPFAQYLSEHTAYSAQAISDFAADCSAAVTEDLHAINLDLIVGIFAAMRSIPLYRLSPVLVAACFFLTVLGILFLSLMHNRSRRAGRVLIFGSLFMGTSVLFVPIWQFLLFDYVGRLNITASAFKTLLSGILETMLYGCFAVLLALMLLFTLLLMLAIARAAKGKKRRKSKKTA